MSSFILAVTLLAAGPFVGGEQRITSLHNPSSVAVAASSDATLVAWNEGGRIRARVANTTHDLGNGVGTSAASDGRDFLIVWQDGNRYLGARWSNPSEVRTYYGSIAPPRSTPIVVWDGSMFQVLGALDRVDSAAALNGVVLTTSFQALAEGYRCLFSGLSVHCGIFPANYTAEWKIRTEPNPARSFGVLHNNLFSSYAPGAAAGKNEFLIAWRTSTSIDGRRLHRDGATLGFFNIPVPRPLTGRRGPQIAFDGTRYLIVFDMLGTSGDIWAAVVVPGENYIAEPFLIAGGAEDEFLPAVTAIGPDRFVVAYTIDSDAIGTRVVSFKEPASRRRPTR
jgi:hypothetical protein